MLITTEYGKVEISLQVITSIVKKVVAESYGPVNVGATQQGLLSRLFGSEERHGIKVNEEIDGSLILDIELVLEYGVNIPVVAKNIQENVFHRLKEYIEATAVKVNVYVVGIQD
ncbi:MAG: Asp23/Gls24 family envelope stress response protein [Kosmotoga sp.]|nr:MAG: Asp23/Gls24 family envelope stress response protein [Kosmotoga sp.]